MRTALVTLALVALATTAGPAPADPVGPYSAPEGKFQVRFPGAPKVSNKTADTAVGEVTVTSATYATSDGNVYLVSYTDFPTAPKRQHLATLFGGVRDGVKGSGKLTGDDKEFAFGPDRLPAHEFVVEKGKQHVRMRAILRDNRLYQVAVVGTADFVGGKDANLFFESFEITK